MIPRTIPYGDDLGLYNTLWSTVVDVFEAVRPLMFSSGMMMLAGFVVAVWSAKFAWRFVSKIWR